LFSPAQAAYASIASAAVARV